MKRAIVVVALLAVSADAKELAGNEVAFTPIEHATMVIEAMEAVIYVDPVGAADRFAAFAKPDLILIAHVHGDHLAPDLVGALKTPKTTIFGPASVIDQAVSAVREMKPRAVSPYPYRGQGGLSDVAASQRQVQMDEDINVHLLDWYGEQDSIHPTPRFGSGAGKDSFFPIQLMLPVVPKWHRRPADVPEAAGATHAMRLVPAQAIPGLNSAIQILAGLRPERIGHICK